MKNPPKLSIVIPLYQEGASLENTMSRIQMILTSLNETFEFVLVDDGSPDGTWIKIECLSRQFPMIRAIRLSRNFGKESALAAGIEMAKGDAVIVMDGDLQHPPELIPEMVRIWRESHVDVVEAIKDHRSTEPLTNRIGAMIFYAILKNLSAYDLKGATDYKLMDRRVIDAWLKLGEHSLFFRGMVAWLGFRHVQIPFMVQDRVEGQSHWSVFQLIRLAVTAVTAFSSFPLHFITLAGMGFLVFAVILGSQTLFYKLVGEAVSGFATVILLLLIIGGALMIGLGVIGEYISRIYDEVKGRPRYIIAERIDRGMHDRGTT
jgi:glycosyltransferase involved in cell wall biosynthesis